MKTGGARGEGSFVGGGQGKEGQKVLGCMKEPQASHLGSIKSVIFWPQYIKQMDQILYSSSVKKLFRVKILLSFISQATDLCFSIPFVL